MVYNGGNENSNPSQYLAWETPWTEEPGGLQSMGSQRVGHDLATKQQQLNKGGEREDTSCRTLKVDHSLGLLKIVPVYACCSDIVINSSTFHVQKHPHLDHKL